jgi:hypothetical protein
MKAKRFSQFILEMESYQLDQLGDWLDGHPYDGIHNNITRDGFYISLTLYQFPEIRTLYMDRLDRYPRLAAQLELEDLLFWGRREGDEWRFWFEAGWGWDQEQVWKPSIPPELGIIPLSAASDDEAITAVEAAKERRLQAIAEDGELTDGIIEEILDMGDWETRRLLKNPELSDEWLLRLADQNPEWKELAKKHPNWPEDVTDWALGDW